jgi:hypothetical protein
VQRVDEFIFYDLSIKVHSLTGLEEKETPYNDLVWVLSNARDGLSEIFKSRPLHFSAQSAIDLFNRISSIIPQDFNEMVGKIDPEGSEKISWWEVERIKRDAENFERALRTECSVMDAYYVVKKGAFSTKDLVENAHFQIPMPSRSLVPQITRDDFDQAGKCLAFDVYTAAAFHLLRGTEAVVREYYELVVPGPKKAPPKMRNWGTYVRLLRNHGGKPTIISIIDHLRDAYRNPVLHPTDFYDEERVLALFGLCVSAVILLQSEISQLKNQSGALQFPSAAAI